MNVAYYRVVTRRFLDVGDVELFNVMVNDLIAKGWQPFGGAFLSDRKRDLIQTMVRYTHEFETE